MDVGGVAKPNEHKRSTRLDSNNSADAGGGHVTSKASTNRINIWNDTVFAGIYSGKGKVPFCVCGYRLDGGAAALLGIETNPGIGKP